MSSQHNAWIHACATLLVCGAGIVCGVNREDWCWLVVAIVSAWVAEGFNTALECLADAVSREPNSDIGRTKDVAAGAVLIAAIGAAIIGVLVFWPHVFGG